jgi:signal transduction histidine kinase
VLASFAALALAFRLRDDSGGAPVARRLGAATLMGGAVAGMHYTAMAAAVFAPLGAGVRPAASGAVLATDGLAAVVVAGTLLVLALALLGTAFDRWLRARLSAAREHERLYREAEHARREADAARAEAERRGAEAAAASRAKSDLLRTMSHELRTPLNAIGGYVQLLEMELRGPLTEGQREDLGRVARAQRRLLALVDDVLDFARIERGGVAYDRAEVPLSRVLDDVHAVLAPALELKGLTFTRGGACDVVAWADWERVRQVLLNVVGNSVKFTPRGGRVAVACEETGGDVLVRVSDTGVGVPADRLEAIFEPFVQVSTGLTRHAEGVGLGLAIGRDLARGMGGDLTVDSAPGAGSTFTLRLPAAAGVRERTPAVAAL